MISFHQWRKSLTKNAMPRQITWVCGEARVLVDDVVSYIARTLAPAPWNYASFIAGDVSEREVWAAAEQLPMDDGYRVVIMRSAEYLKDWERFTAWVKARTSNPRTFLVLVSGEAAVPRVEPGNRKSEIVPHLADLGTRGHVIECRPVTSATALGAVEWVQSKVKMREGVAKHLLERSNFDLRMVRDLCVKLKALEQEPTIAAINELLIEQPRDEFTDALLAMDKRTALLALRDIAGTDIGRILGKLDSRLDLAAMIHDMRNDHRTTGEMMKAAGAQAWLVPEMLDVAKHYTPKRRLAIRKILAVADEAYRGGNEVAVLESVVVMW